MESQAGLGDQQKDLEQETRAKWESRRPSLIAWAVENGELTSWVDELIEGQVELAISNYHKNRASAELEGYAVLWDRFSGDDAALQELLDNDPQEGELQQFLDHNPKFLIQVLTGGHGRYQIPPPEIGERFRSRFSNCPKQFHWD